MNPPGSFDVPDPPLSIKPNSTLDSRSLVTLRSTYYQIAAPLITLQELNLQEDIFEFIMEQRILNYYTIPRDSWIPSG
jgi:hypothetical protein